MNFINIYIPRILGSVNKGEILEVFEHMDIGKVTYIDMISKTNENNNKYYYAFITVKLSSSIRAQNFKNSLTMHGMIRLLYDEEAAEYWEIHLKIDRKERVNVKERKRVPFYRYDTLSNNLDLKLEMLYENYKPYDMWDTSLILQGVYAEL
jgi:translation initiation factor RLI1